MKTITFLRSIKTTAAKTVFSAVVLFLLFIAPVSATTYYVSLSGNDSWLGTSSGSAWRHIAYGTQQVQAGDTLIILSGNYGNEQAEIANNGTQDSPIVIKAEVPGEVDLISSDGSGTGIYIEGKSHIIIEGLKFTNFATGIGIKYGTSYVTVRKCIFIENNSVGLQIWGSYSDISATHHFVFTENQFYDYTDKQDYGIYVCYGTYVRAANNYFFGKHHQALSFKRKSSYCIASNNIFEGFLYSALYLGQNLSSSGDDQRCYFLIAEGNTFCPAQGYRAKTPIWVANAERAIVRNNFMEGKEDVDGGWGQGIALGDYESGYESANTNHVSIYNNVIRTMSGTTTNPGIRLYHKCHDVKIFNNTFTQCSRNLGFEYEDTILFKNNIFYDYENMLYEGTAQYAIFEYNDICPYWSGCGSTDISVNPEFVGPFDSLVLENENPKFIPDFTRAKVCQLQGNSLCIDAGTHLTETIGSCTSNVIEVEDAGYFTDGFGIADGDSIRVGANDPVKIVDIDYDNNKITIDQSISCNDGDGVSLVYYNSAPDIGAYEYNGTVGTDENLIFVSHEYELSQAYPNPFNPQTTISYQLAVKAHTTLKIYNTLGQEIRTLINENKSAGNYSVTWDGKDAKGNKPASGIYYYRLTVGKQVDTKKMLYLK